MNEDSRPDREQEQEQERPRPRVVDKRVSARRAEAPAETGPEPAGEPAGPDAPATPRSEASSIPPTEPAAQPPGAGAPGAGAPGAGAPGDEPPGGDVWTPEREEQARRLAEELARAPARDIVVTMAMNFVEVASVKIDAGDFPGAQLAIDAFDGVLNALGSRLGDAEGPLRQMLAQLQMAYAQRATQPPPANA
jgi:hypothetical protein